MGLTLSNATCKFLEYLLNKRILPELDSKGSITKELRELLMLLHLLEKDERVELNSVKVV